MKFPTRDLDEESMGLMHDRFEKLDETTREQQKIIAANTEEIEGLKETWAIAMKRQNSYIRNCISNNCEK